MYIQHYYVRTYYTPFQENILKMKLSLYDQLVSVIFEENMFYH